MRSWPHSGFSVDNSVYVPPHHTGPGAAGAVSCVSLQPGPRGPLDRRRLGDLSSRTGPLPPLPGPASAICEVVRDALPGFQLAGLPAGSDANIPKKAIPSLLRLVIAPAAGIRAKSRKSGRSGHHRRLPHRSLAFGCSKSAGDGPGRILFQMGDVDPGGVRGGSAGMSRCGSTMKIISFIERCQGDVIERILRHCGLWEWPCTHAGPRARRIDIAPSPQLGNLWCYFQSVPHSASLEFEYRETEPAAAQRVAVGTPFPLR